MIAPAQSQPIHQSSATTISINNSAAQATEASPLIHTVELNEYESNILKETLIQLWTSDDFFARGQRNLIMVNLVVFATSMLQYATQDTEFVKEHSSLVKGMLFTVYALCFASVSYNMLSLCSTRLFSESSRNSLPT